MKKIYLYLFFAAILIVACKQMPNSQIDLNAEKAEINLTMDSMYSAMFAQDVKTLLSFYSDEMIGLGSDPSEFWNRQQVTDIWKQMLSEPIPKIQFLNDRFIHITSDGNYAVAVDQYIMPLFSDKLPFRHTYHLIKKDGKWTIFFWNVAFIPRNEDIPKINAAIE